MYTNRLRVRDQFLSTGHLKADVPPLIADSWRRSLTSKVNPALRKSPDVLQFEKVASMEKSNLICHAFQTIVPKIESFFNEKYAVILADNKGRLSGVHAQGDLLEMLQSVNAIPGGLWTEEACGTNAFGTTLVTGTPLVIHDAQHFCETWHIFSCAGVPIFHPANGQILGVLDLTCAPKDFPANALILTAALAKSMEIEIFSQLQIIRLCLENAYLEKELYVTHDSLLAVDTDGQVVRSNHSDAGLHWNPHFDWPAYFQSCVHESLFLSPSGVSKRPLPFTNDPDAGSLQLVYYQDRIAGALVQMKRKSEQRAKYTPIPQKRAAPQNAASPAGTDGHPAVIGQSRPWVSMMLKTDKIAKRNIFVLLTGESGTGKEVLARYIHRNSNRSGHPFVAVNCSALTHDLAASELFGYAPGTFTGGLKEGKKGLFEEADGGTLFLDEIGELPLSTQAMLLRVLQEGQATRIGEYRPRQLDVRVITATNRNLRHAVHEGNFRQDLYFRLNAVELKLPALREREEDVLLLAEYFLRQHQETCLPYRFMSETKERLLAYPWPGNVRELKHAVEHAVIFSEDERIYPSSLPEAVRSETEDGGSEYPKNEPDEKSVISDALRLNRYNLTKTAKQLGISRGTLYKKMERYQIK